MFLNSVIPFAGYKEIVSDMYYVDKSRLLTELFPILGKRNRYFCITRPRRFGKSVMANMVGAFFENTSDSSIMLCILISAEFHKIAKITVPILDVFTMGFAKIWPAHIHR